MSRMEQIDIKMKTSLTLCSSENVLTRFTNHVVRLDVDKYTYDQLVR